MPNQTHYCCFCFAAHSSWQSACYRRPSLLARRHASNHEGHAHPTMTEGGFPLVTDAEARALAECLMQSYASQTDSIVDPTKNHGHFVVSRCLPTRFDAPLLTLASAATAVGAATNQPIVRCALHSRQSPTPCFIADTLCEHLKRRTRCITCGGGALCPHGRMNRAKCALHTVCVHNKAKAKCRLCGNTHCVHGIDRRECGRCSTVPCRHGQPRHGCPSCRHRYACRHGKRRSRCLACGGTELCLHGRPRHRCAKPTCVKRRQ